VGTIAAQYITADTDRLAFATVFFPSGMRGSSCVALQRAPYQYAHCGPGGVAAPYVVAADEWCGT
jgi:hypothetical protein